MPCLCPISIPDKVLSDFGVKGQSILVPCGHCVGCAHDKINDWFVRLYSVYNDFASRNEPVWFVTVTIDPKIWPGMTKDTYGVRDKISPWIRSWNERLRYLNGGVMPLRFLCSEFGSLGEEYRDCHGVVRVTTGALHFHGFLFGYLPIKRIQDGLRLTHGYVDFDRVRSAACIRYAVKYATKDYSISDPLLRSRTFCSPGLGDPALYFGDSTPTNYVLINGFHYRCPRYLVEKQWKRLYGGENFYDSTGRSILVKFAAVDRIEQLRRLQEQLDAYKGRGLDFWSWYCWQVQKHQYNPCDYAKLDRLLALKRIGPGHPLLRYREQQSSYCSYVKALECDRSFVNYSPFISFQNQFNYERYQTFVPLSFDFTS